MAKCQGCQYGGREFGLQHVVSPEESILQLQAPPTYVERNIGDDADGPWCSGD
jgi:hypothetical protein